MRHAIKQEEITETQEKKDNKPIGDLDIAVIRYFKKPD